jgi:CubicO group peptidase (beta-lactamase class C family)
LERHVESGFVPGALAVLARHGEVHVEATGTLAFEGAGSQTPMAGDTVCRMGSMSKPIVAACAMTLVEDCTLRLDDPVDDLLPELADMRVLADPNGPLEDTVPANRPITLRDLLTFTLGTGMVPAEPGTIPIADAAGVLDRAVPPDQWMGRLGALPLVHQPGERWMYETAANVTVVLIARANHLSPAQKAVSGFRPGYFDAMGWGFGMSVRTSRTHLGPSVGTYGWSGFYGTAWYNDPAEDMATIVLMQRAHAGDQTLPMWHDFWTAVYQAIDD